MENQFQLENQIEMENQFATFTMTVKERVSIYWNYIWFTKYQKIALLLLLGTIFLSLIIGLIMLSTSKSSAQNRGT